MKIRQEQQGLNQKPWTLKYLSGSLLLSALLLLTHGCWSGNHTDLTDERTVQTREITARKGAVSVELTFSHGSVSLDRDIILSIRISHSAEDRVELPILQDRLQGLMIVSSFERDIGTSEDGRISRERVVRLNPLISSEYRLAPMAIAIYSGKSNTPPSYMATPPAVLPLKAVIDTPIDAELRTQIKPVLIHPSIAALSAYAVIPVLILLLIGGALFLISRIKKQIEILRLSPKERALYELSQLLDKKLVEAGQIKTFYIELTLIVRRYIERCHRVRAPEQTTQEFLQAVASDPRFTPAVLKRLQEFLEAADLVKFDAWKPDRETVEGAVKTAREYLETDSEAAEAQAQGVLHV